jgi:hypothetical protein
MKGMFLCKQAKQDLLPGIVFLASRVKDPNKADWKKLQHMLDYLQGTQDDVACLSADNTQTIKWYINLSFAMHKEMRSHTGAVMTLDHGALILDSTKQKVNTKSLMESDMIAVDDTIRKLLWTKKFIEAQGHKVKANIVYQDNTSAMMQVEYCPTNEMVADYITKPLVGSKFIQFKNRIMGKT